MDSATRRGKGDRRDCYRILSEMVNLLSGSDLCFLSSRTGMRIWRPGELGYPSTEPDGNELPAAPRPWSRFGSIPSGFEESAEIRPPQNRPSPAERNDLRRIVIVAVWIAVTQPFSTTEIVPPSPSVNDRVCFTARWTSSRTSNVVRSPGARSVSSRYDQFMPR